ncbi:MAG: flagellar biosynthetic protein FliR [Synergistaceae bacterium]|nr:flagellar biosynthetic protein FliR [Synergistota bacterium]NLM70859.1 flagellar biosynthetic protein FliR [Synergistaceae bacterium]
MTADQTAFVSLLVFYLLTGIRFTGMMFTAPIFFASASPIQLRFWTAFILTLIAAGAMRADVPLVLFEDWTSIVVLAIRELLIGALTGFLAALPLYVLQISGELIGISMGLSMLSVMDPLSQVQVSIIGQLQFLVGMWFYFKWNGHLLMTQAIVESLTLVPPGKLALAAAWDMGLGAWLEQAFVLSLRFVLPFYGAILLADTGLGFLARTVPQMNIFVLGLPLKITLGFFVLMVVLPETVDLMTDNIERFIEFALMGITAWR